MRTDGLRGCGPRHSLTTRNLGRRTRFELPGTGTIKLSGPAPLLGLTAGLWNDADGTVRVKVALYFFYGCHLCASWILGGDTWLALSSESSGYPSEAASWLHPLTAVTCTARRMEE